MTSATGAIARRMRRLMKNAIPTKMRNPVGGTNQGGPPD